MPIYSYGGKLLFSNQGAASVSQSCCCDDPPPPPGCRGPCCVGSECSITTSEECAAAGGTFYGCIYDCDDYTNLCTSPPTCTALGCTPEDIRVDAIVVTIDINEFSFDTSLQSCLDTYQTAWQNKVEQLNGTYVLTKKSYFFGLRYGFFYESGVTNELGHLVVSATFDDGVGNYAQYENAQGGFPCISKLQVAISYRNFSIADPFYSLDYFEGGVNKACYIPSDLRTETTYVIQAGSSPPPVALFTNNGWYVDMCDGLYLESVSTGNQNELVDRIAGDFADGPNCDVRHCIGFKYAGTASLTLVQSQ